MGQRLLLICIELNLSYPAGPKMDIRKRFFSGGILTSRSFRPSFHSENLAHSRREENYHLETKDKDPGDTGPQTRTTHNAS